MSINRRDFLKASGVLSAQVLAGHFLVTMATASRAQAVTGYSVSDLLASLGQDGSLVLVPSDKRFQQYQPAFNKRTALTPQVRVLPASAEAVAKAIAWARQNKIPFAIRSGGHSYEGYSQSEGLVIDTRLLNNLKYDSASGNVTIGAGVTLGAVYQYLSQFDRAIPAGSCPPVGVSGHTLGGGFGLLARKFGLACDSVVSMEMVDAGGNLLNISATENPDLFWALRGGGNGQLGLVTQFVFQTHPVKNVVTFGVSWVLPPEQALKVIRAWQNWAPNMPDEITSIFRVSNAGKGKIGLRCAGLSVDSAAKLRDELQKNMFHDYAGTNLSIKETDFIGSVHHFAGEDNPQPVFMKAKSDYLFQTMSDEGIQALMKAMLDHGPTVVAIFDSYGGAIGRLRNDETAFVHRENAKFVIQYYSEWTSSSASVDRLKNIREIYQAMRPYVSGGSYVNYCDLDLENPLDAYWGTNLPRLMQIKALIDPDNFFCHAQSLAGKPS